MKKTFVALAALATIGTVSAEVSVYGAADVGLVSITETGKDNAGLDVVSGNFGSSNFGVKASHDLTGGIKVMAQYEMGINAVDAANLTTDRVAMVGLTGGFGTLGFGLQWTPYDSAWGFDQMGYSGFSAPNKSWYKGVHGDNGTASGQLGNAKKSVSYTTPDMNGFNATVMYANEKVAAGGTAAESVPYIGLGANYGAGPLGINFGYEQIASSAHLGGTAAAGEKTTAYIVGASYDLGMAKVGIGFQAANVRAAATDWKDSGYTLSVSVPVSASTTVALAYAAETTTSAGRDDGKSSSFGAQATYNWTKQATVYFGANQVKATSILNLVAGEITTTEVAAGLRYNF